MNALPTVSFTVDTLVTEKNLEYLDGNLLPVIAKNFQTPVFIKINLLCNTSIRQLYPEKSLMLFLVIITVFLRL